VSVAAFRGGVRDYLKKPIQLGDLLAQVEALLAARREAGEPGVPVSHPASSAEPANESGPLPGGVRRALAFIEGHLEDPLSLDQVAREAGMSKFHFCRHFKADTGLTFREFLAHRRIARAAELLRDGSRSVSEVYLDVGFKDLSHFGRVFRRIIGQPPSRYRRDAGDRSRDEYPPAR
jgi:AraC-like DNA-binding protein